jgi:hypothetical protein
VEVTLSWLCPMQFYYCRKYTASTKRTDFATDSDTASCSSAGIWILLDDRHSKKLAISWRAKLTTIPWNTSLLRRTVIVCHFEF